MSKRYCQCGNTFQPKRKDSFFCSVKCYSADRRSKPENKQKARERSSAYHRANRDKVLAYNRSKRKPVRCGKCAWCGEEIRIRTTKKFCNISCRARFYRRNKPEMYKAMWARYRPHALEYMKMQRRKERQAKPWIPLLRAAKVRAKKRRIPFSLTEAWAEQRWTGRCELSNVEFVLGEKKRHNKSPSIDQIEAGKGYTPENCRFILWCINAAKGVGTDDMLYTMAEALIKQNPQYLP